MLGGFARRVARHLLNRVAPRRAGQALPQALSTRLPRGAPLTLVDVGAYQGDFTACVADCCGVRRGVLIEPLPGKAALLRRRFPTPPFDIVECAASDAAGRASLRVQEAEYTSSLLAIRRGLEAFSRVPLGGTQEVPCLVRTLDDVVAAVGVGEIDLLKIDVQGYEDRVLRGAAQALTWTRWVWIEVSFVPLYDGSCTFETVHRSLSAAGFGLLDIEPGFRAPDGELLQADALFFRQPRRGRG
jgi:FkbM family methyltransferase